MPDASYDVVVIGAGLAGCGLAIQMARRNYDVLLLEKKNLPTHKLCGEFLSPESRRVFRKLGVLNEVLAAGAHPISSYRATVEGGSETSGKLPDEALGLSRYRLDKLLFDAAGSAGATVHDGCAVTELHGTFDEGFDVTTEGKCFLAQTVVAAYGKRGLLDRKLERSFLDEKSGTVAFKAHFEGYMPAHQIELHAFSGGYCGIQQVENARVNVCWIGDSDHLREAGGSPEEMLSQSADENQALGDRLSGLTRTSDRFEAVSQVYLKPKSAFEGDVCMIGDTAGMIAPMCGDGMAMALDAANMLAPILENYLDGEATTAQFKQAYERDWRQQFRRRMFVGRWLHHAYTRPALARPALQACKIIPPLERWVIQETRG